MLDFHIWPWFERVPVFERNIGVNLLPSDRFPNLTAWVGTMQKLPAVKATSHTVDQHVDFVKPFVDGDRGSVNYDCGLPAN